MSQQNSSEEVDLGYLLKKSNDVFANGYAFNTLIAACMEALNALNAQDDKDVWTEGYFILLNLLEPNRHFWR